MKSFVHLHNHTEYSMLDGAAKVTPLFTEAQRLNMPAVGMTDHGNMFGASEFYNASQEFGIKPIIGIEAYVSPGSRYNMDRVRWGDPSQKSDDVSGSGAYTHLTMVAENAQGLRNLFVLSSRASMEGQLGKWPRMDAEIIAQHSAGIIATTGCPSGEVQTRLRLGQWDQAIESASKWQNIFGKENYFLELMDHGIHIERKVREDLLRLGKELGIPPLATNDCHYVHRNDSGAHEALLCVQTGKTLSDPGRFKFDGDGYYLKSPEEMRAIWDSEVPGACDGSLMIAERVQSYDQVWKPRDLMPTFAVPDEHDAASWLRSEVHRGLRERFAGESIPEEYVQRVDYELSVIIPMGFSSYFLIVADLIAYARRNAIRVGPGRGSAAGSLVAWALGIVNVDPMRFGLLFERFLNPDRISMPDIDIDFDDRRRGEMLRYASETFGSDRVAQVITFGTIKTKAALRDSARVLYGQPGFAMSDRLTKALPPAVMAKDISLSGIYDPGHERYNEASETRMVIEGDPDLKKIYETALGLEGLIRNSGVHACAVIMSKEPLQDTIPVWKRPADGALITGWDYPACEAIGLLKMDFLGLRTLTVIGDTVENIKRNRGIEIDIEALTLDDPETFKLLSAGNTLGVFQLDSGPMRDLLRRMMPTAFEDIIAVNALYRPGPMAMNAHNDYADRKNNRKKITPIHPELHEPLKDILGETYGLIVYQEQIMNIAQTVAGYSLARADILRKAMGKKKEEVLQAEFAGFAEGMRANGYSDAAVEALWNTVLPFAGYAFNKSHAAGYAMVSYWTAYLKANYPAEYMAALLSSVGNDKDKAAMYLADCRHMGITVLPPDVNVSETMFASVGKDIRFGLASVLNVSSQVVESIMAVREKKGKYASFHDFLNKVEYLVCNKRVIESLIKAGAFDSLHHPRKGLFMVCVDALEQVTNLKKAEAMGQIDLFSFDSSPVDQTDSVFELAIPEEEWDKKQKLSFERQVLGLYVSGHPLEGVGSSLQRYTDTPLDVVISGDVPDGSTIKIAGILSSVVRKVNKSGSPYANCILEDMVGRQLEFSVFPANYVKYGELLVEDAVVAITARVNSRDEKYFVMCVDLTIPELTSNDSALVLSLPIKLCTDDNISQLQALLKHNKGTRNFEIIVHGDARKNHYIVSDDYLIDPCPELVGDLKYLFGAGCVGWK